MSSLLNPDFRLLSKTPDALHFIDIASTREYSQEAEGVNTQKPGHIDCIRMVSTWYHLMSFRPGMPTEGLATLTLVRSLYIMNKSDDGNDQPVTETLTTHIIFMISPI